MLKVCENCEFISEQYDIEGNIINACLIKSSRVGLWECCKEFVPRSGEHVTR